MGRSAERPHCSARWGVRAGIIAAASLIGTVPTAEAFAPGRAGAFVAPQTLGGLASGSRGLVCADLPDGQGMLAGRRAGAIVGRQLGGSEKFIGGARSGVESSGFLPARSLRMAGGRGNTRMSITVLTALSSPVVLTAAALGTLDGCGRLIANFPRVLELQYAYASRLLETGSTGTSTNDPVAFLRSQVLEKDEYKSNVLNLFVKYDTDRDGKINQKELEAALEEFPGLCKLFGKESASTVLADLDVDKNGYVDYEEFLSLAPGDLRLTTAENLLKLARDGQVSSSYESCKTLTAEYAKTFYLATLAMEDAQAKATWAIYAWCRRVDEIVDGPLAVKPDEQQEALDEWMQRLDRMWEGKSQDGLDTYDIAFVDMLREFPGSDIEPYRDMVKGMMMDIPDKVVYRTWEDLYLYCYRVASTVGLMTLPVMGTAKGVTLEAARDPAVALGIALQITNILRDVGEDARDRGRIYLPVEDLEKFGVTEEYILTTAREGGEVSEAYKNLMKFEIERAMNYYRRAEKGIPMLSSGAQLPVGVASELYKEILLKIIENDYDNFNKRAYVSKERKLLQLPFLWLRTVTGGWGKE